jgi:hypothetical protein
MGAATWPRAARSQQSGKVHRIGYLWENANTFPDALEAFRPSWLGRMGCAELEKQSRKNQMAK